MFFDDLGLSELVCRAVRSEGYTSPTEIQSQAIPPILAGRDLLASAQTGTGKTAAFALPTLDRLLATTSGERGRRRPIRALVLSPTRELAQQIAESFQSYGRHTGLRQVAIVGGVRQQPQTNALDRGVDIVVATPGRLVDLMEQGYVDLSNLLMVTLDEADQMLDMGFAPDLRRILDQTPKDRQTLLFSATLPTAIVRLANSMLVDPVKLHLNPATSTKSLIHQTVYKVDRQHKSRLLQHLLTKVGITRALIFTRTKRGADVIVRQLRDENVRADSIHSDKSQAARQRILENFRSNKIRILVATDIAARGIDVDAISHVLNYDMPDQPETYVHRIGRTGRAGATGSAVSFCDASERKYLVAIERHLKQTIQVASDHPKYPVSSAPAFSAARQQGRRPFPRRSRSSAQTSRR
jgi:ATP-dependent RNA helicase RhlE